MLRVTVSVTAPVAQNFNLKDSTVKMSIQMLKIGPLGFRSLNRKNDDSFWMI